MDVHVKINLTIIYNLIKQYQEFISGNSVTSIVMGFYHVYNTRCGSLNVIGHHELIGIGTIKGYGPVRVGIGLAKRSV